MQLSVTTGLLNATPVSSHSLKFLIFSGVMTMATLYCK